jgi:hypothetical protein
LGAGDGVVHVLYGSPAGIMARRSQLWSQLDFGGTDRADSFGQGLASGDFDADGFSDLAVGDAGGSVGILYGSGAGLTAARSQLWSRDSPGIIGEPSQDDLFGWSLAAGDLGGGFEDDLVIGMPRETGAGEVHVIFGSRAGLTADGNQVWSPATRGVRGKPESGDQFGAALAVGDFDGRAGADLAVGAPRVDVAGVEDIGTVNVIYSSNSGLTARGNQRWEPGPEERTGGAPDTSLFGTALAAGRFAGRDFDDLAIGEPGGGDDVGAVHVLYGSRRGLSAQGRQLWTFESPGIGPKIDWESYVGNPEFGASLAAANFGRDKGGVFDDLAIGIPGALGTGAASGFVQIMYGSAVGLGTSHTQQLSQSRRTGGFHRAHQRFGSSIAAANFGKDAPGQARLDLAVGAPGYALHKEEDRRGAVNIFYGSAIGLRTRGAQLWTAPDLPQSTAGESFGVEVTS